MKKPKQIIFLVILIIIIGTIYYAYTKGILNKEKPNENIENNIENENSENQNEEKKYVYIEGTKEINGIEITNIKITLLEEDKCEFTADVKNKTEEYKKATNLRIKTKDENGETKEIFGGWITDLIPKEENTFKTYVLADITHAQDVEIEQIVNDE